MSAILVEVAFGDFLRHIFEINCLLEQLTFFLSLELSLGLAMDIVLLIVQNLPLAVCPLECTINIDFIHQVKVLYLLIINSLTPNSIQIDQLVHLTPTPLVCLRRHQVRQNRFRVQVRE